MLKKLKRRIAAYRKISAEIRQQEEKQKQYEALVGESLSYPIIKDLINTAQIGVTLTLFFKDGTRAEIRREETPADPNPFSNELF